MRNWTHLIRFIAVEDGQQHLGQLFDTDVDVGVAMIAEKPVKALKISGTIFDGIVTDRALTVKQLLSPLSGEQCPYIRATGLNYKKHIAEAQINEEINSIKGTEPGLFSKPRTAITGPYPDFINVSKVAQDGSYDFEAELCVVIGKTVRDVKEEDAMDAVLGYMCSNDVTARTMQFKMLASAFAKGLDSSCPIGPVIVSSDVIKDPQTLSIKAIYNGQTLQDGNTKDMIFSVADMIVHFSKGTTLEAGSIILTGTPEGVGFLRTPRVYLEDGSEIRIEIEKIGSLINKVRYD